MGPLLGIKQGWLLRAFCSNMALIMRRPLVLLLSLPLLGLFWHWLYRIIGL